jgi:hypothetical protein
MESLSNLWNRLVEWFFRIPTLEATLIRSGTLIIVTALSFGWVIKSRLGPVHIDISTAEGIGERLTAYGLWIGVGCIAMGVSVALCRLGIEYLRQQRSRIVCVELRGLRQIPDTPLLQAKLRGVGTVREEILLDLRQGVREGDIVDPDQALRTVAQLPLLLRTKTSGYDRTKVRIVAGGLAPVPFLVLAGALIDDESDCLLVDWDRDFKRWCVPDGDDDHERFTVSGLEQVPRGSEEVVLAVSISYVADTEAITSTFPGLAVVSCALGTPRIDSHRSTTKQIELVRQFREVLNTLSNRGVHRTHVILACPSSLAVRLGMSYDRRNMPHALIYQYERGRSPAYPWAVRLPTNDLPEAEIISLTRR